MNLNQFDYNLPDQFVAHAPTEPRDHARLLVLNKETAEISHQHFYDLPTLLTPNDVLVFNNTKVFPARLFAGKTEILLLRETGNNTWTAMHRGKVKINNVLNFESVHAKILSKNGYEITIGFLEPREAVLAYIELKGKMPLPPYIHTPLTEKDIRDKYQTVYAKEIGSVASPTAGLHFTKELIDALRNKGIQVEYITLHVGAGTFLPIKENDISKHTMHSEDFEEDLHTLQRLNEAKALGKRIISVGTTTTRVLETLATNEGQLRTDTLTGETSIYIYPPYKFKFIDALITNFHLPHSTLLALVSALVCSPNTDRLFTSFTETIVGAAYTEAQKHHYKFYSFGDGMMIG